MYISVLIGELIEQPSVTEGGYIVFPPSELTLPAIDARDHSFVGVDGFLKSLAIGVSQIFACQKGSRDMESNSS